VRVNCFAVTMGMDFAAQPAETHSGWSSGEAESHIAPGGKLAGTRGVESPVVHADAVVEGRLEGLK
jgi:predicted hotdog family 3-hydroxylacyl-ACP dehydratase